jgi:hypothetical protein
LAGLRGSRRRGVHSEDKGASRISPVAEAAKLARDRAAHRRRHPCAADASPCLPRACGRSCGWFKEQMRRRMHQPIPQQGKWLWHVVRGYFNFHAVPTNFRALAAFRAEIARGWHRRVLTRRSQRGDLTWTQMKRLIDDWLPQPRILHPWPDRRFAVTHPRWEPYAGKSHVRNCAGGAR